MLPTAVKLRQLSGFFKAWGICLSPAEVEETRILLSRALQVALKYKKIKSIVKSHRIIPKEVINNLISKVIFPDMSTLAKQNRQELKNLIITQVHWDKNCSLGLTLNDDKSCKAGTVVCNNSHTFDPTKKITRVEVIIEKFERSIVQINFFSGEERLVAVGLFDDYDKSWGGRRETFEMAADEQLIGCELDHGTSCSRKGDYFIGVTWLKWKIN